MIKYSDQCTRFLGQCTCFFDQFQPSVGDFWAGVRDFRASVPDFWSRVRDFWVSARAFRARVRDFWASVRLFQASVRARVREFHQVWSLIIPISDLCLLHYLSSEPYYHH